MGRMLGVGDAGWQPQRVREVIRVLSTSTEPVEVLTDVGRAYLKHPENREGAHALGCEWLGTRFAQRLGLRTFETTRISYDAVAKIELSNGTATAAECFITKYEDGYPWDGTAKHLKCLDYLDAVTRLVVLDTWLRNTDRQFVQGKQIHRNNSNVFFARLPRSKWCSLVAMDFSQLLIPLWPRFDLSNSDQLAHDPSLYGLFPEFAEFLRRAPLEDAIAKMLRSTEDDLREVLDEIPDSWGADDESREATARFLRRRAEYLGETLIDRLVTEAPHLSVRAKNGEIDAE